ncbi:hypothetical protein [Streptomyces turgidiscabies]|uniref:hypothetical protein n=1 Tax=Streptomyces turgidiscabies TaxID=85558 RepID=UPI00358EEE8C
MAGEPSWTSGARASRRGSRPTAAGHRSRHSSAFALVAHPRLAAVGRHVAVNRWAYRGPHGQSLFGAVDFLRRDGIGRVAASGARAPPVRGG